MNFSSFPENLCWNPIEVELANIALLLASFGTFGPAAATASAAATDAI